MLKDIKLNDICIDSNFIEKKEPKDKEADIAIVGISVNLPTGENLDDFWNSIIKGEDVVKDLSSVRKNDLLNYLEKVRNTENIEFQQCAYLNEIDKFDSSFFNISPTEANLMSPLHRLHMEVIWKALEDYGYSEEDLNGKKVGIFSGLINDADIYYYRNLIKMYDRSDLRMALTGSLYAMISARISYFLNLKGPSIMIDSACSSSMSALISAIESIKFGQCKAAVVSGAYLKFMAVKDENELIGIESADGRTRSFDNEAEGSGFGEGVVALVIKKLKDAERDNDRIYGVIKGYASNQDGRSLGITAPNLDSQCDVIKRSLSMAKVSAEDISYFETHGTATNIGDVIEVAAMEKALKSYTNKKAYCAAGSVKSNIGHLFAASGVTSIIKCVLAIKHGMIPPSINFNYPNKKINFLNSPIYINTIPRTWKVKDKKRCCISNFGISGTNCNIILEEYQNNKVINKIERKNYVFSITAKSKNSLKGLINKYIDFLEKEDVDLMDLSYSTLVRRNHFKYRLILIVSSISEAISDLKYALNHYEEENLKENIYYNFIGNMKKDSTKEINDLVKTDDLDSLKQLCKYYINGFRINWNQMFSEGCRYIDIPSYYYDRKRYWVELKENSIYKMAPISNNSNKEEKASINDNKEISVISTKGRSITENEKIIGEIWAKVLGFTEVQIEDNYFEMGGDSILGIKIINLLNAYYKVDINVSNLLESATVEKLAKEIENMKAVQVDNTEVIKVIEKQEYYDLSSSQMRIFLLEQIETSLTKYNINSAYLVEGTLDIEKLEKVINEIIERHEVLRSQFVICDGIPKQKVLNKVEFKIEYVEKVDDIDNLIQRFVRKFDLEKPPLLRALVGNLKDGRKIFLFDMHHLVTDGTSFDILINEIEELYNGGKLKPLNIQYKDYAAFYNNMSQSAKWAKEEKYWLNKFKNEVPVLNLPTTYAREDKVYTKGKKFYFEFSDALYNKLKVFVKENKVTNFMVTISALYILLHKYSGDKSICIGTPTSGRFNKELNNLIGVFINTLVIKNQVNEDTEFCEFLDDVKSNVLSAFDNADYGFEYLVQKVRANKDISRNPLFDVMFIYQNLGDKSINLEGSKFTNYDIKEVVPKYDITLELLPKGNKIFGNFEYSSELFSEKYIGDLYEHYINVLEQVISNKDIKIKDIDILTPKEKEAVLKLGKGEEENIDKTVIDLFNESCINYENNKAVIFKDKTITYKELNEMSNKIACYLDKECRNEKMIFPVVMNRSIELIAVLIGILKAGGSYIPLDPSYPKERIDYILKDSESEFILTSKEINYENKDVNKIYVEHILKSNFKVANINKADLDNNSYIIYTSGSTGNPKGVIIRHREMSNFIQGMKKIENFTEKTKMLSVTTISFDIFVLESFVPLCSGSTVVLASEKQASDVEEMCSLIRNSEVNMAQFTPSRAQMLLVMENNAKVLKNIDTLFIGGEAFPEDLLKNLKKYSNGRIINMYGPTETTVWSSYRDLTNEDKVSIGKPILNTNIYILNNNDDLQFIGGSGEIAIGGLGVTKGYVNNKKLTDEKFIKSKFNDDFIYKTGDLGKWLDDGNLYHMGRMDNQVKVRGYRIELGEIEEVILKCQGVLQCAVIVKNINNTDSIAAFVTVYKDFKMEVLKDYIKSRLPEYMIPASITVIDKIPMTANGKVNRKELSNYETSKNEEVKNVKAESETEKVIFDLWVEILNHNNFGVNSKFFEVGGNSLLLIKMLKLIKDRYETNIKSSNLFALQTISKIALYIDDEKQSEKLYFKEISLPDIFFSLKNSGHIEMKNISLSGNGLKEFMDKTQNGWDEFEITSAVFFKLLSGIIKQNDFGVNITKNRGKYSAVKIDLNQVKSLSDLFNISKAALKEKESLDEYFINNSDNKNQTKILLCINEKLNFDQEIKKFGLIITLSKMRSSFNIEFVYNTKIINKNAVNYLIDNYKNMLKNMGVYNGKQ